MFKDSNGVSLNAGDSVQVIKDLKLKGSSATIKRGTIVKNIRLGDREGAVSYTHLTLPTSSERCRSRWSPYH